MFDKPRYIEVISRLSLEEIKKILNEMHTRPALRSVRDHCIPVLNAELARRDL